MQETPGTEEEMDLGFLISPSATANGASDTKVAERTETAGYLLDFHCASALAPTPTTSPRKPRPSPPQQRRPGPALNFEVGQLVEVEAAPNDHRKRYGTAKILDISDEGVLVRFVVGGSRPTAVNPAKQEIRAAYLRAGKRESRSPAVSVPVVSAKRPRKHAPARRRGSPELGSPPTLRRLPPASQPSDIESDSEDIVLAEWQGLVGLVGGLAGVTDLTPAILAEVAARALALRDAL